MRSLRRRILGLCFRWIALCPPRRGQCLLALVLLFCNMTADFFAVL